MSNLPVIAVTMGDPCGIGPEVVARALCSEEVRSACLPLVVGNVSIMEEGLRVTGVSLRVEEVEGPGGIDESPDVVSVLDMHNLNPEDVVWGRISAEAGRASMEWAKTAAELCLGGEAKAMATAPIHKEAASLAGYKDVGHMEVLQSMTKSPQVATMLMSGTLRVVHLTTHRSLRRAPDSVTRENVLAKIMLTHDSFKQWGFEHPRIGVAALNPHASDGGLLGDEEATAIEPAVNEARDKGVDAIGPVPADTIFNQAIDGKYDAVLAMYHDQGHIPVKVYGFEESVSINLGLPLLRTSVDHGTAYDIAGKGVAQATSMIEAIKLAASVASGKGLPR